MSIQKVFDEYSMSIQKVFDDYSKSKRVKMLF
jgi:hypothetical protein